MDKGLISCFEVKHCGLYRYLDNKQVYVEGSLGETIDKFCEWTKDRKFPLTIPWDANSSPKRTQIYCKSVAQDATTKDTLLVLWKRFGDDSGKVTGISPDAKVGLDPSDSIQIDSTVKGQSAYLGQPMYYWVIPDLNIIASINFPHSTAATKDVCLYLKRCIDYRIDDPKKRVKEHEGANPKDGTPRITKFVRYEHEDGAYPMQFRLHASTKKINSQKANPDNLAKKISRIVVRDTISTTKEENKDSVFNLWSKVKKHKKFSKNIEIIEEASLSSKEISEILDLHSEEYDPINRWNDIGFKEKGSDSTRWFSKYISREQIRMNPLQKNQNYYSADDILNKLMRIRGDLLIQASKQSGSEATETSTCKYSAVKAKEPGVENA